MDNVKVPAAGMSAVHQEPATIGTEPERLSARQLPGIVQRHKREMNTRVMPRPLAVGELVSLARSA